MKILIADDDPQILRALRITLNARGYDIVTAEDGQAAISSAIDQHPDLVMLDLGMPRLDGLAVIDALQGWSSVPSCRRLTRIVRMELCKRSRSKL